MAMGATHLGVGHFGSIQTLGLSPASQKRDQARAISSCGFQRAIRLWIIVATPPIHL